MIPPNDAFLAPVDDGARLLLVLLWTYANRHDPHAFVWPTIATLAERLGVPERTVYRRLAVLRKAGLVRRCRQVRRWREAAHDVLGWSLQPGLFLDVVRLPPDMGVRIDAPPDDGDTDAHDVDPGAGCADDLSPAAVPTSTGSGTDQAQGEVPDSGPAARLRQCGSHAGLVDGVLAAMRTACCSLHDRAGCGPDDCAANRELVLKCAKKVRRIVAHPKPGGGFVDEPQRDDELLADFRLVIASQLENVRNRRDTWRYLTLSTICRPANFVRIRDTVPSHARSKPFAPSSWDDELPDEPAE